MSARNITGTARATAKRVLHSRPDRFSFDGLLGASASQQEVYETCVAPLVPSVLDGVNATVLAFGQTGSGKTYTVLGAGGASKDALQHSGVAPRAARHIFELIASASAPRGGASDFSVRLQLVEIYNVSARRRGRQPPLVPASLPPVPPAARRKTSATSSPAPPGSKTRPLFCCHTAAALRRGGRRETAGAGAWAASAAASVAAAPASPFHSTMAGKMRTGGRARRLPPPLQRRTPTALRASSQRPPPPSPLLPWRAAAAPP